MTEQHALERAALFSGDDRRYQDLLAALRQRETPIDVAYHWLGAARAELFRKQAKVQNARRPNERRKRAVARAQKAVEDLEGVLAARDGASSRDRAQNLAARLALSYKPADGRLGDPANAASPASQLSPRNAPPHPASRENELGSGTAAGSL